MMSYDMSHVFWGRLLALWGLREWSVRAGGMCPSYWIIDVRLFMGFCIIINHFVSHTRH